MTTFFDMLDQEPGMSDVISAMRRLDATSSLMMVYDNLRSDALRREEQTEIREEVDWIVSNEE